MKRSAQFILLLFVCMNIFCGCSGVNSRVKELYDQFEIEDSLHEKTGYYRKLRRTLNPNNKKEMEYNSKAWESMQYIFRNTPPWLLDLDSLADEDVAWMAEKMGAQSSFNPEVGMGISFDGAFNSWGKFLAARKNADIHTETVEDQFKGVRNMALLYSFDGVKNYRDIHNIPVDPISMFNEGINFLDNVPHLDLKQKEPLPTGSDDLKILILGSELVNDSYYHLEARLMIEELSLDMIPENGEDIDILILVTRNRGWKEVGQFTDMWGTSTSINAFDFRTGYHMANVLKEYASIESFLESVKGTQ